MPVYAEFHRWLGRGDELQGMWDAWAAGDRKAALAAIPDSVVDELVVHGSPAECRAKIQGYFDNGVTTSSLAIMPLDPELDYWQAVKELSPSAAAVNVELPSSTVAPAFTAARWTGIEPAEASGERCPVARAPRCASASMRRISATWRSPRSRVSRLRRKRG